MTTYATMAELREHLAIAPGDPDPTNGERYLRTASGLVAAAIEAAVYRVDGDGVPTDTATRNAVRDATLIQAEAWIVTGVDPLLGRSQKAVLASRPVESKSASGGGLSVKYAAPDARLVALADADGLIPEAWAVLNAAGLITTAVQTRGGAPRGTYLVGTEYRLTTGEIVP